MTDDLRTNLTLVLEVYRETNAKATDYVARFGHMDRPTVVYIIDSYGTGYINAEGKLNTIVNARAFSRSQARTIIRDAASRDFTLVAVEIIDAMREEITKSAQGISFVTEALAKLEAQQVA
jgi:hypothetical protein